MPPLLGFGVSLAPRSTKIPLLTELWLKTDLRVRLEVAVNCLFAPSPPSDGGEGWGEEETRRRPLSPALSPLVPRGDRESFAAVACLPIAPRTYTGLALFWQLTIFQVMALTNLTVAEEALSLSPVERAGLAKLLIQSLRDDPRTDEQIKTDLTQRLKDLVSGADPGLTFEEVFGSPQ